MNNLPGPVKSWGGLTRVTASPCGAHDIPAGYSPSGSRIVLVRNNDPSTEAGDLFVVNTDGSGLRRITAPDFAETLEAGPGRQVDPVQQQGREEFAVHPDGSGLRPIRLDAGPGRYFAYGPVRSPDGTRIVLRLFLASTGGQHL